MQSMIAGASGIVEKVVGASSDEGYFLLLGGNRLRYEGASFQGLTDRRHEFGGNARLRHISRCTCSEGRRYKVRIFVDRKKHNFGPALGSMQPGHGLQPIQHRHGDINDQHVRIEPRDFFESLLAIRHGSYDVKVPAQYLSHARQDGRVVISKNYSN